MATTIGLLVDTSPTGNNTPNATAAPPQAAGCVLYTFTIMVVLVGILFIAGVIGNIISFIVFMKDTIRSSTTYLFQVLAVADTLFLFFVVPLYVLPPLTEFTRWEFLERYATYGLPYLYAFFFPIVLAVQLFNIWITVLVGINRYIAVCLPYSAASLCSTFKVNVYITCITVFSFVYCIPAYLANKIDFTDVGQNRTEPRPGYTEFGNSTVYTKVYENVGYTIFYCILPLMVLSVLNMLLVRALNDLQQRRLEMQSRQQKQDNSVTLVLVIIIMIFLVCQFPALVNRILYNALNHHDCGYFHFYWRHIANMMVILNSSVNFWVYYFFNRRFREMFEGLCGCARSPPRHRMSDPNTVQMTTLLVDESKV